MLNEQLHQFWLSDSSGKNTGIYRVAIGDLIKASERETITPAEMDFRYHTLSGSIGFVDVTIREEHIPEGDHGECKIKSLVVLDLGIEPKYKGRGYARVLERRIEELAEDWGLDTVVGEMIENKALRRVLQRRGYVLYNNGLNAVKRLRISAPEC